MNANSSATINDAPQILERRGDLGVPHFTLEYAQPEEYHFCQDSIIFAQFVAKEIESWQISPSFRMADICAGCGVIGLEIAHLDSRIKFCDFLEIQSEFQPFFIKNLEHAKKQQGPFKFIDGNYSQLLNDTTKSTYDLIVANPPYFSEGDGKLSPSHFKNRCRHFLDSDLKTLLRGVSTSLKPTGVAYILMKGGTPHGRAMLREAQIALGGLARVSRPVIIRGTNVLKIEKAH